MKNKNEEKKKCTTCMGYGFWAIGRYTPIGPIDAGEGVSTTPCPECGASQNPINRPVYRKKRK